MISSEYLKIREPIRMLKLTGFYKPWESIVQQRKTDGQQNEN